MKIVDVHAHVWLNHAEADRRDLLDALDAVPLEQLWVSGLCGHHPDAATVRAINDSVAELMRRSPRVVGFAYLNPVHQDSVMAELDRCCDLGFRAIKLWVATTADDPRNFPIYQAAVRRRMPLLLHCFAKAVGQLPTETTPPQFAAAARRFPDCAFLMAHMAGDFITGVECAVGLPNAFLDLSGSYGENGMVEYAVERLGADHVLFGTDMPGSDLYHNLGKVAGARLSESDQNLILYANAKRLLP